MRCYECEGIFMEHKGSLIFHDKIVGDYTVNNIEYFKCDSCGELAFPAGVPTKIEEVKKKRLEHLIGSLPLDDFITASEAADILGVSRQAMHKHRRIRRGFIHSKKHSGRQLYSKKSVELFKETGDGRFSLNDQSAEVVTEYVFVTIPYPVEKPGYAQPDQIVFDPLWVDMTKYNNNTTRCNHES